MNPKTNYDFLDTYSLKVKNKIISDLRKIKELCFDVFDDIVEIILWGSFSFGEGRYKLLRDGEVRITSDYDLFIISEGFPKKITGKQRDKLKSLKIKFSIQLLFRYTYFLGIQRRIEGKIIYSKLKENHKRPWIANSVIQDTEFKLITIDMIYTILCNNNEYYKKNNYFPKNYSIFIPLIATFVKQKGLYFNYEKNLKVLETKKPYFITKEEINFLKNELENRKNNKKSKFKKREETAKKLAKKLAKKIFDIDKNQDIEKLNSKLIRYNFKFFLKSFFEHNFKSITYKNFRLCLNPYANKLLAKYYLLESIDKGEVKPSIINKAESHIKKIIKLQEKASFKSLYEKLFRQNIYKKKFLFYSNYKK